MCIDLINYKPYMESSVSVPPQDEPASLMLSSQPPRLVAINDASAKRTYIIGYSYCFFIILFKIKFYT